MQLCFKNTSRRPVAIPLPVVLKADWLYTKWGTTKIRGTESGPEIKKARPCRCCTLRHHDNMFQLQHQRNNTNGKMKLCFPKTSWRPFPFPLQVVLNPKWLYTKWGAKSWPSYTRKQDRVIVALYGITTPCSSYTTKGGRHTEKTQLYFLKGSGRTLPVVQNLKCSALNGEHKEWPRNVIVGLHGTKTTTDLLAPT